MSVHAAVPGKQRTEQALEDALEARTPTRLSAVPALPKGMSLADGAQQVAAVVVPVAAVPDEGSGPSTPQPRRGAAEAAVSFEVDVAAWADVTSFAAKAGDLLTVAAPSRRTGTGGGGLPQRLILLGVGDESAAALRTAGAALAKATAGLELLRSSVVDGLAEPLQAAFVEGFLLGGYRPPRAGLASGPKPMASVLELTGAAAEVLRRAAATAKAVWLARDLANMPSNLKNPAWLASQAQRLAAGHGLQLKVRDEQDLAREGFGGTLAVGQGSASPPRLLELSYTPTGPAGSGSHIVLVGKGITFDTGGLSLKPREAMVPMKTDMAGAGVVLAVLSAAAELGLPHRITGLLPLAENAIGASSYRPGDVVTVYGGTTVEIGNTDAEGRMVLSDALAYAVAGLAPDVLVDIATLTGAASRGLGRRHAALYSNRQELVSAFEAAADGSGERVWHMPLAEVQEEYGFALESSVADISHIASAASKVGGGSITAALFLSQFVADTPWVHLDIAGPARADKDEAEVTKGATGYGTRLLLEFLRSLA
ncbi:leucyl aminopeptidase family protein [Arthrobacter sp. I2-34]|uniref:Probable cytosol aminopeptidase n=1 Tax=Arthrobacter hankyongi TaxID=2904801 RepID=A0ABS9LCU6_9MICC|nr:leucyl aminopeptidase family protein [Arthrobacter hankyongi]MCG2624490.1 leucyl aminopeptidase family protein [Arthrobacter hankyongi]